MVHNRPADTRTTGALDDCLVRLRDAKLVHCNRDGRIEPRFSGSPILFVVLSGQGFLTLGRHRYRLRRDAVYLCPPGHTFGMEGEPAEGVEIALFRFDLLRETKNGQGIEAVSERSFLPDGEIGVATADQLPGLCDTLFRCWHSRDELERFRSQIVFQELLWHLLKNRPSVRDPSRTRLDQAKTYMERNFHENLTIEQLARIADVSPKYFVDLFKKTYGISAMDYLTELRMIRARELMVRSRARLRDIAHQVGYQDEFYFSRKFKKEIGMSPTVYMKSRRRKVAACEAAVTGHLLALNMIPFAAPLNPKWTPYYYDTYRNDISVHLSAYRKNVHRASNLEKLRQVRPDIVISTDGT